MRTAAMYPNFHPVPNHSGAGRVSSTGSHMIVPPVKQQACSNAWTASCRTAVPRRRSVRTLRAYSSASSTTGTSCTGSSVHLSSIASSLLPVVLFHYHLVTAQVREVEARYLAKLSFGLVARHGRIGEELTSFEAGHGWDEVAGIGFKLRLSGL